MATNKKAKKVVDGANIGSGVVYSHNINNAIKKAQKDIVDTAKRYKNNSFASQTGFVAEEVHIGSFNIDSAIKRSSLKAVKEKNGFHGDYKVLNGDKVVAKGEFKHYSTAEKTENAMRSYGERDLVGASDQVEDIKKIARKKELKNQQTRPEVAKEHKQVAEKVTNKIEKDGVKSKPKTLKEQKKITKKATRGKVDTKELLPDLNESLKSSAISGAKEGAKVGVVFGGGVSVISNIADVYNGKKSTKQAVVDTVKETAVSAIDGAAKNVAGSMAKVTATHVAQKVSHEGVKKVLGSSAPVVIATTTVEMAKDVVKYASGDIDGEELAKRSAKTAATSAGAWAGAEAGAMIGAIGGPVGAVVGGVVGGIIGSIGIGSLFD